MRKTIDVAKSFQTSINISYDIHNKNKVSSLISTQAAIDVIEDILLSTDSNSTDRARILIGAYGKGKSHIILVALNILFNKDKKTFSSLLSKLEKQHNDLYNYMNNYLDSEKKLLPIIISGSSVDLTQSFLNAMQTALKNESLLDIMPETNFHSAIRTITQWKTNYPETYNNFSDLLDDTPDSFIASLANFEVSAYSYFVDIFPKLTSGSTFNPFVGLDVVELYEEVNDKLCDKGYNGMYIVYDEFSKYLESSIINATISDIKLLQDFAEKCVRSGRKQMHLLLITHKDISNYIDEKLPKEKVDGWRGVSGRFKHINVHNHFSQMYEIMSSVILKDRQFWSTFTKSNKEKFANLSTKVILTNAQQYEDNEYKEQLVYGCYPLHPISMFILPRVSEKVAQNERTLFTFLSSDSKNTLLSFLQNLTEDDLKTGFPLLTPDKIYDYFEQLFRKDNYNSRAFKTHKLTNTVLHEVEKDSLHSKIIKTLSLIYIIEQFEKLAPTRDVIISAFSDNYSIKVVDDAIQELINKNCIIYLKRSNGYLKIKESSGIDIRQEITKLSVKTKDILSYNNILNDLSFDNYMYPTAYNDEKDMVRYFDFAFMTYNEFSAIQDWNKKLNKSVADGLVLAIVPENENQINEIRQNLENGICSHNRVVTVLPKKFIDIQQIAYEYYAVDMLQKNAIDDEVLFDEYSIFKDDLGEVISEYILGYTRPEYKNADYYYLGEKKKINRKAQLSNLLSNICDAAFINTPVINNELINKNNLSTVAVRSRNKVVSGLLSNTLEYNLGLHGVGQEVSFMRSTLIQTNILINNEVNPKLNMNPDNGLIANMLNVIVDFFITSNKINGSSFAILYDRLINPEYGIGMRKGIIPIYIAVALNQYKKHLVILHKDKEVRLSADLLTSINRNPQNYYVYIENWNDDKERYIDKLALAFNEYTIEKEKHYNSFSYVLFAMTRWYMGLPRYSKELSKEYVGMRNEVSFKPLQKSYVSFIKKLKNTNINAHEFLFEDVCDIYNFKQFTPDIADNIIKTKELFDAAKSNLITTLIGDIKSIFLNDAIIGTSLTSCIKDFYEPLNDLTKNHVFSNGENRILELMSTISNDEKIFVQRIAKTVTQLRIDDWNEKTIVFFTNTLTSMKKTIDSFDKDIQRNNNGISNNYKISFVNTDGNSVEKTFSKVEYSNIAKLLYNDMESSLDEYGRAISDDEKRQILMELIEKFM